MEIRFMVNGNKNIFKSKAAKQKLRALLKQYNYLDLRFYWDKFKVNLERYLGEKVIFTTKFMQGDVIEIIFKEFETLEEKEKEINRGKLKKLIAKKRKDRQLQGSLKMLKEEEQAWEQDLKTDREEVRLYLEARKQDPKRYVPDPNVIRKSPRNYIRDYVDYMKFVEKMNPNSILVYEYDPYVIYMRRLLDMEDDDIEEEIEI